MSTLKTVWTCGLVCLDSTMRCAMMLRILVMGTRLPGMGTSAGVAAEGLAGAAAGAGFGGGILDVAEDVRLGDASGWAGAGDSGQIDVVVLGNLAHQRRGTRTLACSY